VIEWKGLFANTPYSSANNKTQDDAVVGMQDTIYVTGPGYGGYSANVRVHNASGAVVALIPVSGGGGALSAPAPVRILDDSTTYSYSLEVVRGAVPSDDADKIVIRIVGGASKRYPGQGSTLADGSTSFAGPVQAPRVLSAWSPMFNSLAPRAAKELGFGYGVRVGVWGSSSDARVGNQDVAFRTTAASANEYNDSWWIAAQAMYGAPFSLEWNGGVAGHTLDQTAAKIDTDLAAGIPTIDIASIRIGANNLPNGETAASLEATTRAIVSKFLSRGIKVHLITPHTQNPMAGSHDEYRALAALCDAIETEYPGVVLHSNTYAQISNGIATPSALMWDDRHLNYAGNIAVAPAFERLYATWGRPVFAPSPEELGEVVMRLNPWAAYTSAGVSADVAGTPDRYGRQRKLITASSASSRIYTATVADGVTLAAGDQVRLYANIEIVASGSNTQTSHPGIGLRNATDTTDAHRCGVVSGAGTIASYPGQSIPVLSHVFTLSAAIAAAPQISAYIGSVGAQSLVGQCALIRVSK